MSTENRRISVSELDFDQIKSNLKQYLRGQSEFSDYDFEGSALSVLLDILSVNTHYNALYNNLMINELFLDSATKRNSVVSRANELGYIPHSARCSEAVLNITVTGTTTPVAPTSITIPKHTPFSTNNVGTGYTFYTTEDITALNNGNGVYNFTNVVIKEGTPLTYRYIVSPGVRFIIPNVNADTTTLKVRVQENTSSSNYVTFNLSDTLVNITATDNVYFIKEIEGQLYELTFGDGVLGKALSNGNVVHLEYFVCSQAAPNGARVFTYNGGSLSGGNVSLSLVTPAYNGSAIEDIESIRYNAPKSYTTQNRAITAEDYKTLIYNNFPEAQAVSVWGGETNVPPKYGTVYISIVPDPIRVLSDNEKQHILNNVIAPRKALSITPEIVDPIYIKIQLNVSFYYNPQLTIRTASDLTTLVQQTVQTYNQENLSLFGGIFKHSHLSRMIDETEPSITSNITTVKLQREIVPAFNVKSSYTINLANPIYNSGVPEESIITTGFNCTDSIEVCYIDDLPVADSDIGSLRLFYYNSSGEKVILKKIGTVNYATGVITITTLAVTALYGQAWTMTIKPQSNDVLSTQNQFAQIDPTLLTITPVQDYPTKAYTFTSSRN